MKIFFALLAVSFCAVVLSEDILSESSTNSDGSTNETTIASSTSSPTVEISSSPTTEVSTNSTTEVSTNSTTEVSTNSTTEVSTTPTTKIPTSPTTEIPTSPTTEIPTSPTTKIPTSPTTEIPSSTTSVVPSSTTITTPTGSSTSEKPVTSTLPPVTPTVDPKPKCTWNVTVGDVTCIRAEMQAQFIIHIEGSNDSYISLGCNAELLSHDCPSNDTQKLILSEKDKYTLTMEFEKDSDKFSARNITLQYTLPDGEQYFVYNDSEKLFTVKVGNSYLCNSDVDVYLGNVTLKVSEMHIQAFAGKDDANFGTAEECNADDPVSDIIPIAVGVVLVALVLVVLVAYLIGRRRKSQKGYQTFQE